MLRAILNKSWRQNLTRHQLYGHLPPITKTIQVRRTRHAGHCWRSRDELISDVLLWTPHMAGQKQDDQLEHTYSSNVRIRDVALKTCQRRWTIGRSGERGSGISVLAARHDDYDDDDQQQPHIYVCVCVYIYIYICILNLMNIVQNYVCHPYHKLISLSIHSWSDFISVYGIFQSFLSYHSLHYKSASMDSLACVSIFYHLLTLFRFALVFR